MFNYLFGVKGASGYSSSTTAQQVADDCKEQIKDRTFVITGASGGIGLEAARALVSQGGHVILACRPGAKAEGALASLKQQYPEGKVELMSLQLDSFKSIRAFAKEYKEKVGKLDVLINNAGIMACPLALTEDGHESQLATNHYGHFLLTNLLLDLLLASGPNARVVMLASEAHKMAPAEGILFDDLKGEKDYSPWGRYGQSKLANVLHALCLNHRLQNSDVYGDKGKNVTAYSVHPGVIPTDLFKHSGPEKLAFLASRVFQKSVEQGAATTVFCAVCPKAHTHAGGYFADCNSEPATALGQDLKLAERLWELSEEVTKETTAQ